MAKIVLIGGSPSIHSRGTVVIEAIQDVLERAGHQTVHIEVRDLDPAALIGAQFGHPDIRTVKAQLASAHGLVLVSPVYKETYSGILKTLIDLFAQDALVGKTAWPIATGAASAHEASFSASIRGVLNALQPERLLQADFILDDEITRDAPERGVSDAVAHRLSTQVQELVSHAETTPACTAS